MTYNKYVDIKQWYHFVLICVPTKFGDCNICKSCDIIFLTCHVITWSKVMSPNGCIPFHLSHQTWFMCLFLIQKIGNSYEVRQLLKNKTENSYYKVITKSGRSLLQSASDITDCGRLIKKCVKYYKVRQTVITKCVRYYKVRQLLQSKR